jgi:tRNA(Arg) A34 adenosine deaminase TadA
MSSIQNITAIIYDRRGKVLSIGKNSYVKTHPYQAKMANKCGLPEKQYLHAEISAIIKCRDLKKAFRILVTRLNKHGEPALAKPCPVCQSAIIASGIRNVEHT